jgi:hypothetical protein
MTRQTSVDAYNSIRNSGALSKLRWKVYDFVFKNGPCTAKQVHLNLREEGQNDGCYTTRMSELRDSGLLFEVGTAKCEHTGREVTLWDVTANLPIKVSKKDKIIAQIEKFEKRIIKLKIELAKELS